MSPSDIEARDNPYKQLIPDGNPREGWELSKRSVRWSQGLGKLLIDGDAFIIEGPPAWALASIIIGMRKEILRLRDGNEAERMREKEAADDAQAKLVARIEQVQAENEALRARDALRDRAEGQSAFDLQAQVEALKAACAADEVGLDVVIRELRETVARLNDRHHNRRVRWAEEEVE